MTCLFGDWHGSARFYWRIDPSRGVVKVQKKKISCNTQEANIFAKTTPSRQKDSPFFSLLSFCTCRHTCLKTTCPCLLHETSSSFEMPAHDCRTCFEAGGLRFCDMCIDMCHCRACRIGISNLAYSNGDSEVEDFDLDFDVLSPYRDCCPQCHQRIPVEPLDIAGKLNHGGTSFHSQGLEPSVCNPTNVSVMSSFLLRSWMEPF
jgi:hypothetical protein